MIILHSTEKHWTLCTSDRQVQYTLHRVGWSVRTNPDSQKPFLQRLSFCDCLDSWITCIFRPQSLGMCLLPRFSHNVCPSHVDSISLIACVCSPFLLPLGAPSFAFLTMLIPSHSYCIACVHLSRISPAPLSYYQKPLALSHNLCFLLNEPRFYSKTQLTVLLDRFSHKVGFTFLNLKNYLFCLWQKEKWYHIVKYVHRLDTRCFWHVLIDNSVARVIDNLLWLRVWRRTRKSNDKDDLIVSHRCVQDLL